MDHGKGEFGDLSTGGSVLGLGFVRIIFSILGLGTLEQSASENSQQQKINDGDSKKMGKPQVLQLFGGFYQEGKLVRLIIPLRDVTQIQINDRGLIEPLRKTKIKFVISVEIQVNQIGDGHYEREKGILVNHNSKRDRKEAGNGDYRGIQEG